MPVYIMPSGSSLEQFTPHGSLCWQFVVFLYGIEPLEWVDSYLEQFTPHGSLCWQFVVWVDPVERFFTGIGPTPPVHMVLERLFLSCLLATAYFVVCRHMWADVFRLAA